MAFSKGVAKYMQTKEKKQVLLPPFLRNPVINYVGNNGETKSSFFTRIREGGTHGTTPSCWPCVMRTFSAGMKAAASAKHGPETTAAYAAEAVA